ncbi:helix-turn-helix domain-containing protein [Xanthovirga aplysinae]|uniref:helix-turn-helix domain-containing protein n=1 Tax=Xanthovirga aplysinae TaxID=2529853 RepID=UPI0012BD3715|nr:AraC family transcriptional regulator [Xanthovirga aplysinae]MTI30622.1 AraC family transcriptional regulator [Xanthovirga aplysinae]
MEYGEKYLTYKGKTVFSKLTKPYFKRYPKDYVENEACFVFVNEGEMAVRAPEVYFDLNKETAVLAKCMNYFFEAFHVQKPKGTGVEVIVVLLYPSFVEELFDFDLSLSAYNLPVDIKQVKVDRLLKNYKESINILLDNPELADENIIKAKLKEFVILLTKSQKFPSKLDFLAGLFSPANVSFKETINQNLYANLTLEELAHLCNMSLSTFKRKFKNVFNDSPKKYIVTKKLEKAATMLKSEGLRVSDVAYKVGFDSISTFNRNFVLKYGKTPSEYRLSYSEK